MFSRLKLKKDHLLIATTLCFLIASYELAIKKTLEAWQLNRKLEGQVQSMGLSAQPAYLKHQLNGITEVVSTYRADTSNYRNLIISRLAELGDRSKIKVIAVPQQLPAFNNKLFVQKIVMKGEYFSLLKMLNQLEQLHGLGYIRSLVLKKDVRLDSRKDDHEIVMELFMEIIKS